MLLNARYKHNINMQNSWIIGDKEADIIAGISSGITNTILVKNGHKIDELNSKAKFIIDSTIFCSLFNFFTASARSSLDFFSVS